ncbi:MAG TPA: redoxin family protein [Gemmataceae bacterium]|nr:redoxin family protein [Gemmataceae bacterium]
MRPLALLLLASAALAADPVRQAPRPVRPAERGVGRQAPDTALTGLDGKTRRLSDLKERKAVVIALTSTSCPISLKYAPTLARLEKAYRDKHVAFVFVNPVETDAVDPAKVPFTGLYVHDKTGAFAKAVGATTTTDVIVLDPTRTVVYHGAVDDQYGQGYSRDEPREAYLTRALDALLAGQPIAVPATEAPGCALDLKDVRAPGTALTYHGQVQRLVQTHCVECHRKGGVAPFALDTMKDVVAHAGQIKKVVEAGTMPPWFAAPPERGPSPWINDRSLPAVAKADLLAWLAGDRAAGNPADAPRPRTFNDEWQIGTPDLVVQLPKPVKVQAEGTMDYQNVTAETDLTEDRWVRALEVRPTAKAVVHHVLVFVIPPADRKLPLYPVARSEAQGYYAIYVPGNSTLVYPDGFGKLLPKGSKVRFQIHYTPNGTATEDRTALGVVFAKEKPRHEVLVTGLVNTKFRIPAGADDHKVEAVIPIVPFNAKILGFLPHMHVRGKAFRYEMTAPGGKPEVLLDVPRYDFNWQLMYTFAEPKPVPRGTKLSATAWYDNSEKNPANPDPTKEVRWGKQTSDEMMLGYLEFYIP